MNRAKFDSNISLPVSSHHLILSTSTSDYERFPDQQYKENYDSSQSDSQETMLKARCSPILKKDLQGIKRRHPQESQYLDDIMNYARTLEKNEYEKRMQILSQIDINRCVNFCFRDQVISFFFDMGAKYSYQRKTIFLATNIYDRYSLIYNGQNESQIMQIAVACLLIAGKISEIYPPSLNKFNLQSYEDDVLTREGNILTAVDFNLNIYTPVQHFQYISQIYQLSKSESELGHHLLDISLYNKNFVLKFKPQVQAWAILYLLASRLGRKFSNHDELDLDKQEIEGCAKVCSFGFRKIYPKFRRVVEKFDPKIRDNSYIRNA